MIDVNTLKALCDEKKPGEDFLDYIAEFIGYDIARLTYYAEENIITIDPPEEFVGIHNPWQLSGEMIDVMIRDLTNG